MPFSRNISIKHDFDSRQFVEIQGLYERNPSAGVDQCREFLASAERCSFKNLSKNQIFPDS